jgi:hypothetical protein
VIGLTGDLHTVILAPSVLSLKNKFHLEREEENIADGHHNSFNPSAFCPFYCSKPLCFSFKGASALVCRTSKFLFESSITKNQTLYYHVHQTRQDR